MDLIAILQSTAMTEAEFKAMLLKVVVVGTVAMGLASLLLWLFWRNLQKESDAGEGDTRVSTWVLLVSLIVVLIGMSFVVYSLA
jgi:heme/copper-type cytochrome/quinol oxidase subunit 2